MDFLGNLYIDIARVISYIMAGCLICSPFLAVSYNIYDKKTINTGKVFALLFTLFPVLILIYGLI